MPPADDVLKKMMPALKLAAPILQKRAAEWAADALNARRQRRQALAGETALAPTAPPAHKPAGRSPVLVVAGMVIGLAAGVAAGIFLFGRLGRRA